MFYKFRDKYFVITLIALVLFSLIAIRLIKLQIVDADKYNLICRPVKQLLLRAERFSTDMVVPLLPTDLVFRLFSMILQ